MTTPGQEKRGDAALLKAIESGTPVPTTGEQERELNKPAPWHYEWHPLIGEWNVWGGGICSHAFTCGDKDDAAWLANALNAKDALHAYAKAEELRDQMVLSAGKADGSWESKTQECLQHVRSMGWDGKMLIGTFLATYRAAALAKAGGAK